MAESSSSASQFQWLSPYTAWMFGLGRAHDFFGQPADRPSLLTGVLEHGGTAPLSGEDLGICIPPLWSGLRNPRFLPFILGSVAQGPFVKNFDLDELEAKAQTLANNGAVGVTFGLPIAAQSVAEGEISTPAMLPCATVDAEKPLVILGVIDDGIGFAHQAFNGPDGTTRIDAAWVQGVQAVADGSVPFGREVSRTEIQNLRQQHGADEDAIYRAVGLCPCHGNDQSSLWSGLAHGTHVLSTAVGATDDPQVRIVTVDLPPATTWDTSGPGKDLFILSAAHFIFERADQIAAAYGLDSLPVVLNISYGYSGGAHRGSGWLEAALDELVTARRAKAPTALVLPSGNSFLDAMHAREVLTPGQPVEPIPWRIQPDDRSSSFLEIWLPEGATRADLTIKLSRPGSVRGQPGAVVAEMGGEDIQECLIAPIRVDGAEIGQISFDNPRGDVWRALIVIAPTETLAAAAPAGLWHVGFTDQRASGDPMEVSLWIQRDISYGTSTSGARQSYFDEFENKRLTERGFWNTADQDDVRTKRFGSLSGMATGMTSLVVAASQLDPLKPADYSGAGRADFSEPNVDLAAPTEPSPMLSGVRGAGPRSGGSVAMNGTSAAVPMVSCHLVEAFRTSSAADIAAAEASNYLSLLDIASTSLPEARVGAGLLRL